MASSTRSPRHSMPDADRSIKNVRPTSSPATLVSRIGFCAKESAPRATVPTLKSSLVRNRNKLRGEIAFLLGFCRTCHLRRLLLYRIKNTLGKPLISGRSTAEEEDVGHMAPFPGGGVLAPEYLQNPLPQLLEKASHDFTMQVEGSVSVR